MLWVLLLLFIIFVLFLMGFFPPINLRSLIPRSRTSSRQSAEDKAHFEAVRERLAREDAARPPMAPIKDGVMSVAIKQMDDFVLVYIQLPEVTKHILSDSRILETRVDEIEVEISDDRRETLRDIADSEYVSKYERQDAKRKLSAQYDDPIYITLGGMLADPYRHYVRNPQEAVEYIDKLKTKILPKIKSIIESHSAPKSQSFEL